MEKTITEPPVVTTRCKNKTSVSQHEIRKDPWEILNATEHQIRLPTTTLKWGLSQRDLFKHTGVFQMYSLVEGHSKNIGGKC